MRGRMMAAGAAVALTLTCLSAPALAATPGNVAPKAIAKVSKPDPSTGRVTVRIKATDADGDRLTFRAPKRTAKGAIVGLRTRAGVTTSSQGTFNYTPTAAARHAASSASQEEEEFTADTFTVTVSDGYGGTVSVPVKVPISPQNAAPIAPSPVVGTPDPTTGVVSGSVWTADPDGDVLTYTVTTPPAKGTVTVNGTGAFTYTPTRTSPQVLGFPRASQSDARDTFTVTISDGHGGIIWVPVSVPLPPLPPF